MSNENSATATKVKPANKSEVHPWRVCPVGYHYVRTHKMHTKPGAEHPQGLIVTRHGHCAKNPTRKNIMTYDELAEISSEYFSQLTDVPEIKKLKDFPKGDKFDKEIQGWVHYWNSEFHPKIALDPNLVKALIASEFSFRVKLVTPSAYKSQGNANGLLQLMDGTLKILNDPHGELKDHLVYIPPDKILEPSANICAGVRWLFQKKHLADYRLKRDATWVETIAEYKGVLTGYMSDDTKEYAQSKKVVDDFLKLYNEINKGSS